jgi:hypothetical protein
VVPDHREKGNREIEEEGGKKKEERKRRKEKEGRRKKKKQKQKMVNTPSKPKKHFGKKKQFRCLHPECINNTLCGCDSCPEFIRGAISQPVQLHCRQPREAGHHTVHMRGQP